MRNAAGCSADGIADLRRSDLRERPAAKRRRLPSASGAVVFGAVGVSPDALVNPVYSLTK